ncbi:MAG: AI-2E family transporter [Pseudomonadales bacterium]|nr:AI-2E family transporter [Pseudomonadales bacterium]
MANNVIVPRGIQFIISTAAFVIVVAGMQVAAPILTPLFLSVFIAIVCWPFLLWINKRGVPNWIAVLLVIAGLLVTLSIVVAIVGSSLEGFTANLPEYHEKFSQESEWIVRWLDHQGIARAEDLAIIKHHLNPGKLMGLAAELLAGFSSVFTNAMVILFTVIFIFFEAFVLPEKLRAAFGKRLDEQHLNEFLEGVRHYLGIKTATSAGTGVSVGIMLSVLGVDFPVLWGVVAFLLNFIPNIGSIIAAVPAVLLASVQLGLNTAFYVLLGFLVINTVVGSVIEPRIMGRGLGLSTLVVFLSLIFWGWVFGPTGMFLSIPFTMVLKIAFDSSDETRWIAILLGSDALPSAK